MIKIQRLVFFSEYFGLYGCALVNVYNNQLVKSIQLKKPSHESIVLLYFTTDTPSKQISKNKTDQMKYLSQQFVFFLHKPSIVQHLTELRFFEVKDLN